MGNLTISEIRLVEVGQMPVAPNAETLAGGNVVRYDSDGKWTGANATSLAESKAKGVMLEVKAGIGTVAGDGCLINLGTALNALNPGDKVFLSATDKTMTDTVAGANETQTITITGSPTGGSFTLTYAGQTTSAIAYNANAATIQAALEALSTIGAGNVNVTGSGPFTVEFINDLADENVAAMTADGASLTGGTSPDVEIAEASAGAQYVELGEVEVLHTHSGNSDKLLRVKIKEGVS
jgi:hypothetical protein